MKNVIFTVTVLTGIAAFGNLLPIPLPWGATTGFQVRPLVELGVVGIVGITMVAFFSLLFSMLAGEKQTKETVIANLPSRYEQRFTRLLMGCSVLASRIRPYPRLICGTAAGIFGITVILLAGGMIATGTDPIKYLEGTPLADDLRRLQEKGNQGALYFYGYLEVPEGKFEDIAVLQRAHRFFTEIERLDGVRFTSSVLDAFARTTGVYLEGGGARLPETLFETETFWGYTREYLISRNLLSLFVHQRPNKQIDGIPIFIGTAAPTDVAVKHLLEDMRKIADRYPEFRLFIYGRNATLSQVATFVTEGMLRSIVSAVVVVYIYFFFLLLWWQRTSGWLLSPWKGAYLASLPFHLSLSFILLGVWLSGKPLDVVTVCIMAMAVTACGDFIIHYLKSFLENLRECGNSAIASAATYRTEGLLTAKDCLLNIGGFAPLAVFVFVQPIREMGMIVIVMLLLILASTLLLMAPLLEWAVYDKSADADQSRDQSRKKKSRPWQKAAAL